MFQINAKTLPLLEAFPYLRRTIVYNSIYWAALYLKLQKARRQWGVIARVLERTGSTAHVRGSMYKAVAQLVLLYVRDSWVVIGEMLKVLTAFYHRAARQITGMTAKRGAGGESDYPEVDEAMDSTRLHPIGVYIKRWQTTIAEKLACRPVYALCTEEERMLRTIRMVRWWDQDAVKVP